MSEPAWDLAAAVRGAADRIAPFVRETPLEPSPPLSGLGGCEVHLKLENFQATGSFKVRGATHKVLCLTPGERLAGVVTASSGNHGAGVAYAVQRHGGRAVIFVPEGASEAKIEVIRSYGAEVRVFGHDSVLTEAHARRWAEESGGVYVSPYNDREVVAGQGTLGVELERQLPGVDTVFIALGGGGLTAGVAGYLKSVRPGVEVVAASPANAPVMHESVAAGGILPVESLPTLSDGTAGGVEEGSITFELCRRFVDRFVTVTEEQIRDAMRLVIGRHHMLIEGAAGVAVAAFLAEGRRLAGRKVVIVLCGANVALPTLVRVVA
ncbi:MAG: threonine/serine dehydratase [Acidobacteria bacterium]|nr:threonine/serine dehydratase [Acidobacteriota bacterium]